VQGDLTLVDDVAQVGLSGLDDHLAVLRADGEDLAAEACGEGGTGGGEKDVSRLQAGHLPRLAGEGQRAVGSDPAQIPPGRIGERLGLVGDGDADRGSHPQVDRRVAPGAREPEFGDEVRARRDPGRHPGPRAGGRGREHIGAPVTGHVADAEAAHRRYWSGAGLVPRDRLLERFAGGREDVEAHFAVRLLHEADGVAVAVAVDVTGGQTGAAGGVGAAPEDLLRELAPLGREDEQPRLFGGRCVEYEAVAAAVAGHVAGGKLRFGPDET